MKRALLSIFLFVSVATSNVALAAVEIKVCRVLLDGLDHISPSTTLLCDCVRESDGNCQSTTLTSLATAGWHIVSTDFHQDGSYQRHYLFLERSTD